jgi:ribA/ribD-fused uncharacterized protein
MSDMMFDEVGVQPNQPYNYGDWKSYAVHDEKNIKGFFGEYRWLSNFEPAPIMYDGLVYPSTENAYQAAKILPEHRVNLTLCKPYESKRLWKAFPLLDENAAAWDARKHRVMTDITLEKYFTNTALEAKLLATGERHLEELNHWSDVYWGVDIRKGGQNHLGQILMKLRTFIRLYRKNLL